MRLDSNDNRKKRGIGLRFAWNGIMAVVKHERNFRIHIVVALLVMIVGVIVKLSVSEWLVLVLTIGFVLAMEMVNSAIETVLDYLKPEQHPMAKIIKDVAAGAVLIAAITSVVVGCLLFLPKLYSYL
ncbi:diacylglycerol kinase family protein [Lentibacillus sp. N15]|uniref:diacylglycerol kinase family protein n=1 Tax=Lentibacillus songyuanensis TaxID=3136161 RepID=UPI0031BB53A2